MIFFQNPKLTIRYPVAENLCRTFSSSIMLLYLKIQVNKHGLVFFFKCHLKQSQTCASSQPDSAPSFLKTATNLDSQMAINNKLNFIRQPPSFRSNFWGLFFNWLLSTSRTVYQLHMSKMATFFDQGPCRCNVV